MFNYSTTTIVNSLADLGPDKKAYISTITDGDKQILKIKRDYTFEKDNIQKVYKKVGSEPTYAQATIDCSKLIDAVVGTEPDFYPATGRIGIYVALEGSEESVFANDFYQKGLPFSVGYLIKSADMSASDLAEQIRKNIVKYHVGIIGRPIFKVEVSGSLITLSCLDEYQRFNGMAAFADKGPGEIGIDKMVIGETESEGGIFAEIERGVNGFGTFRHLMKDLRLPTAMNTGWLAIKQSERPVPGALYDQYIIVYSADSYTNPSLEAVGHKTKSETTHIFWVRQDLSEEFGGVISSIVEVEEV